MAATARREIDTGEEDIAAIAKQISDHAEAIYQTWKARGLAPAEILSCRPAPALKLSDGLGNKTKPEIKQRPEIRAHRQDAVKPDARRDHRLRPQNGDAIETSRPPDLVPERAGTPVPGARRSDAAAMRLEVAREEERLLRALRTGGVVAERAAERPDVVPPLSLVDYAKSRYQDRLEGGAARKPAAGASGERRASLGSHVTEARTKFEARARRASSAGAAGEQTSAVITAGGGPTPVRPFLSRGSVAERVLMFEKCPSEATLELAKRKTPASTWRGPHDVINRAQDLQAQFLTNDAFSLINLSKPLIIRKPASFPLITSNQNIPNHPVIIQMRPENLNCNDECVPSHPLIVSKTYPKPYNMIKQIEEECNCPKIISNPSKVINPICTSCSQNSVPTVTAVNCPAAAVASTTDHLLSEKIALLKTSLSLLPPLLNMLKEKVEEAQIDKPQCCCSCCGRCCNCGKRPRYSNIEYIDEPYNYKVHNLYLEDGATDHLPVYKIKDVVHGKEYNTYSSEDHKPFQEFNKFPVSYRM